MHYKIKSKVYDAFCHSVAILGKKRKNNTIANNFDSKR